MAKSSIFLAKHIIFLLHQNGYSISNTKVQKLLYCYLGFGLTRKKIPKETIINELPCAWDRGPVFPIVYKMIKNYSEDIKTLGLNFSSALSPIEQQILQKTVSEMGHIDAGRLSTWTHLPKSPWDIVYNLQEARYAKIPLELIKEYFEEEVEDLC